MKIHIICVALALLVTSIAAAQPQNETKNRVSSNAYHESVRVLNDRFSISLPRASSSKAILAAEANILAAANPRIIGGILTNIEQNPWQVALIVGMAPEPIRQGFCGGTLIAPTWVVTAAHCVDSNTAPASIDVVGGTTYFRQGGTRVKVEKIFIHPQWDAKNMLNDIALLKLSSMIPVSPGIVLPTPEVQEAKLNAVHVSGWGTVVEGGGQMSDILMGADIPLVSNAVCNAAPSYDHHISDSMICAGLRDGGLDSCQGDSGGPATAVINGTRFLIGVVSWGEGCARKLKYGVYTRVSSFKPWIDTTLAQN